MNTTTVPYDARNPGETVTLYMGAELHTFTIGEVLTTYDGQQPQKTQVIRIRNGVLTVRYESGCETYDMLAAVFSRSLAPWTPNPYVIKEFAERY